MPLKLRGSSRTTSDAPLQECFPHHRTAAAILKDQKAEAVTVRQLREWIEREIHLDITNAPFDPQDEALAAFGGKLRGVPQAHREQSAALSRSAAEIHLHRPRLLPRESRSACPDSDEAARSGGRETAARFARSRVAGQKPQPGCPLRRTIPQARRKRSARRPNPPSSSTDPKPEPCFTSAATKSARSTPESRTTNRHRRNVRREPRNCWPNASRNKRASAFSNAIRKKLPATLSRPDLEMVALDYFERLGHDNHRRLCRVYGWEEKKTKGLMGRQRPWTTRPSRERPFAK